jgi:hypothetical protein
MDKLSVILSELWLLGRRGVVATMDDDVKITKEAIEEFMQVKPEGK